MAEDFTKQAQQLVTRRTNALEWSEIDLTNDIAALASEAATQGQAAGIERVREVANQILKESTANWQEAAVKNDTSAMKVFNGWQLASNEILCKIESLSPDPNFIDRVRNEARRQGGIEAFTDAVSIVSQSLNGDDAIAKLKELIGAIGDDKEQQQ